MVTYCHCGAACIVELLFYAINHPTNGATCVFVLFNSNRQVALCIYSLFIMAAICISIKL